MNSVKYDSKGFGAGPIWHQVEAIRQFIFPLSPSSLVHPLSAIPGSAMARDLVLIILEVKLIVVRQLQKEEMTVNDSLLRLETVTVYVNVNPCPHSSPLTLTPSPNTHS